MLLLLCQGGSQHIQHACQACRDGADSGLGQRGQPGHRVLGQGSGRGHRKTLWGAGPAFKAGWCEKFEGGLLARVGGLC